jgi:hypothetical protein
MIFGFVKLKLTSNKTDFKVSFSIMHGLNFHTRSSCRFELLLRIAVSIQKSAGCFADRSNFGTKMSNDLRRVTNVVVVVIVVCCEFCHSSRFIGTTYKIKTDASGNTVCALDTPTSVVELGSSAFERQCGIACGVSFCCSYYQFRYDTGRCELYGVVPVNYTVIDNCVGYLMIVQRE